MSVFSKLKKKKKQYKNLSENSRHLVLNVQTFLIKNKDSNIHD